jgi:hypothetical protein
MGPRQSVQEPEQQAYMKTSQDMRSSSSGFHLIEVHTKTAMTAGVSMMLLVCVALGAYALWRMRRRRARQRELAMRHFSRMEMRPSFDMRPKPEPFMELREQMEQPVAVIPGVLRHQSLGFVPRV